MEQQTNPCQENRNPWCGFHHYNKCESNFDNAQQRYGRPSWWWHTQDSVVTDDANINNKLIVEIVSNYSYESKTKTYNINVAPIEPTHPSEYGWYCEPTEEEWRIAQSVPLHIPTEKCVTSNIVKQNTGDLCPMTVLIVCTIQQQRYTICTYPSTIMWVFSKLKRTTHIKYKQ